MTNTEAADVQSTAPVPAGVAPQGGSGEKVDAPVNGVKSVLLVGLFMTSDHRYYFNGKGPVPSVTTIIGIMDKPAIVTWAKQQVAKASIRNIMQVSRMIAESGEEAAINWLIKQPDEVRDKAGSVGSSVHLLADMASRADEKGLEGFQVSEEVKPYLAAFRHFLGRYSASSIVSSEKAVWNLNGYAGTYDLLMNIKKSNPDPDTHHPYCQYYRERTECSCAEGKEDELWLIDIKTSKGYYPEYGLQLAAYRYADSIILPGHPDPYPMPQIQRTGVLHLRPDQYPDTGWRLIEYPTGERDYIAFLSALELYTWKEERRFTKSNLQKHITTRDENQEPFA